MGDTPAPGQVFLIRPATTADKMWCKLWNAVLLKQNNYHYFLAAATTTEDKHPVPITASKHCPALHIVNCLQPPEQSWNCYGEFIALQKPGYDEPCRIIFSDLCSGKVYSSCSSFVLSLNLAPTGDEQLRLYLLQSPLMISSSSLTHFKPRFFSTVDISAAVCDAQRVGS